MKLFFLVLAATAVIADDLVPTCSKPVYCNSELLHHVQIPKIYPDSKTFVDFQMRKDEETTLNDFQKSLNQTDGKPSKQQLEEFVKEYFDDSGELEDWTPSDWSSEPPILNSIHDEKYRQFAKDLNQIWLILAKRMKPSVIEKPEQHSLIPVTHGFVVPGGRFKEIYYWDTYWIVEGLLISGMTTTAKGMIENLIELLNKLGKVPNGSRWYYQERSQPPLLAKMVALYYQKTGDIEFLRDNIVALEKEMNYWLDTHIIALNKDDKVYTLLRYYAPSAGPRPESYNEDYTNAQRLRNGRDPTEFYVDIKGAAESGWDFSSRWFLGPNGDNSGNLTNIETRNIIPVDLNAIFFNALNNVAKFHSLLKDPRKAAHWASVAEQWRSNIESVLWNEDDGIWYDYDIINESHRKYFYTSNFAPLWMGAVEQRFLKKHAPRVLDYLYNTEVLDYPGGIPTSLNNTGEQWDLPNVWPPEVSIVIGALEALDTEESKRLAKDVASHWVRVCYKGFSDTKQMFEKYDALVAGKYGGGGEYTVQEGFGWTNGLMFELFEKYGKELKSSDSIEDTPVIPADNHSNEKLSSISESLEVIPLNPSRSTESFEN
uniref:Trehalase n=1 Tax=Antheraea pernyi TaxID=7119 RepID=A0A2D0WL58_ANTPE|nr:trehalase 1A [Antheraea pernyi]